MLCLLNILISFQLPFLSHNKIYKLFIATYKSMGYSWFIFSFQVGCDECGQFWCHFLCLKAHFKISEDFNQFSQRKWKCCVCSVWACTFHVALLKFMTVHNWNMGIYIYIYILSVCYNFFIILNNLKLICIHNFTVLYMKKGDFYWTIFFSSNM